jgi:putative NIF3 family GTP cyclohydrolase 1 type 2
MTTVQAVIDDILSQVPGAPFEGTLDSIKIGSAITEVTGIVTTFMATQVVLEQAVELGANFVITHEPTFYNHADETDWLAGDPVYAAKRAFLETHELVVWRFHDQWHAHRPDGIYVGVLHSLGWAGLADGTIITLLEPMTFRQLIEHVRTTLGVERPRVIGDPAMPVRTIGLMVGASGGRRHMSVLPHVDALIAGEVAEWETTEWVRDAIAQGRPKGLIVAGHQRTEEPGMAYLAECIRERQPGIPVTHVASGDPFASVWDFSKGAGASRRA